jgi:ATP-binding cassette subfamily B protein
MGTHSELLAVRGKYYQLYTQQFRQQMENALNPLIPGSATT